MTVKKLANLLNSSENSNLDKVIQRAQKMDALTSTSRAALTPDLAENLIAANLRENGELVLLCTSSAWAARLRFETDTVIVRLRETGHEVERCIVRVQRDTV